MEMETAGLRDGGRLKDIPWIPHQKIVGPPLALKNQEDSLGLRLTDHHQRGAGCWHRVFWVSSMKRSLPARA
jgi:hypothetical protein